MTTELRLGVIGLGRAAAFMLPSLAAHPHVRVTAAANRSVPARVRFEEEYGGRTYPDAEALCASGDVDAVYIATPHAQHAADALTAARHGIHAIVEKPMALNVGDCHAMTEAAERAGTVLIIGHTHAYDAPVALMSELIRSGDFGRLRHIVSLVYTNFLYRPRRTDELDSARGGGIMYNQVPHQVDILQALSAAPVRTVRAVVGRWDPERPADGALAAFVTFADGAVAQLTYSAYDGFDSDEFHAWIGEGGEPKVAAHGAARRALSALGPAAEREVRARNGYVAGIAPAGDTFYEPHFGLLLASCESADLRTIPTGVAIYDAGGMRTRETAPPRVYPNRDAVIDELYGAVRGGIAPLHDARRGMRTMEIVFALIESSRRGCEIALDTTVEAAR